MKATTARALSTAKPARSSINSTKMDDFLPKSAGKK